MRKILRIFEAFYELFFSLFGILVVGITSYFFGFTVLRNPLSGNDAINALVSIVWIKENIGNLPLWFPYIGGGVSLIIGYPQAYSWAVVILSEISGYNLFSSMAIWNFASILLPAVFIFLYVQYRFRNKLAALLSGTFYLMMPISYVLISGAGFLANAFATIFAVPILLLEDLYLDSVLENKSNRTKAFYLITLSVVFTLGLFAHPTVPVGMTIAFGVYAIIYGVLHSGRTGLFKVLAALVVMGTVCISVSFFYNRPLMEYTSYSNRDLGPIAPGDFSTFPPVSLLGVLGIQKSTPEFHYQFGNLSVPPAVWVFTLVGFIMGVLFKRKKLIALSLVAAFSIYQTGTFTLWNILQHIKPFLADLVFNRYYYIPTAVFTAVTAGLGAASILGLPIESLYGKIKNKVFRFGYIIVAKGLYLVATPAIVLLMLLKLNMFSGMHDPARPTMLHYGMEDGFTPEYLWNRENKDYCKNNNGVLCSSDAVVNNLEVNTFITYCDRFAKLGIENRPYFCMGSSKYGGDAISERDVADFIEICRNGKFDSVYYDDLCLAVYKSTWEQLRHWPKINLPEYMSTRSLETAKFAENDNPYNYLSREGVRIDITPSLGTWVKEWPINNRSSILNAYTGQLILNKSFNSLFRDAAYQGLFAEFPEAFNNLAKYFGVSYVVTAGSDKTKSFESGGWEASDIGRGVVWKPPFNNGIYEISNKNKVLVIGSAKNNAYQVIFKSGILGALPYDTAILFEGSENVDDYTLDELKNFEAIILYGYKYKNRQKGETLLEKYLADGGRMYIETGWQYVSPDWGEESGIPIKLPEYMPVKQLSWGSVGQKWSASQFESNFDPLIWENSSWNVSSADRASVRDGARVLATADEKIIAAEMNYKKGFVVWTGLNLPAHLLTTKNTDEIKFLSGLTAGLINKPLPRLYEFDYFRKPDEVIVRAKEDIPAGSVLYFKESKHPFWVSKGKIYSVGPRFMGIITPRISGGEEIKITFTPQLSYYFPAFVSLSAILYLVIVLLSGKTGINIKNAHLSSIRDVKEKIFASEDNEY